MFEFFNFNSVGALQCKRTCMLTHNYGSSIIYNWVQ